jgi:hydrogenase maturation protein HypF
VKTFHVHIKGRVQGVGFRPFVYGLANQFGLKGEVNNTTDGVHVLFNANKETARLFYEKLLKSAPRLANIEASTIKETVQQSFDTFEITSSHRIENADIVITPDFAICSDCKDELLDPENFRYQYPFITCTNCGPRYSIIQTMPYDRILTTMQDFKPCTVCSEEYNNPSNRRFYSQTNSCSDCGVKVQLFDKQKQEIRLSQIELLQWVAREISNGKIIAVKGIGGYLLICDASNQPAIQTLRKRKRRPYKPFAVMFPDRAAIEKELQLGEMAADLIFSPESPIVLLPKKNGQSNLSFDVIAPGNPFAGVMGPYAPLFVLLFQFFDKPIIATSGNVSGSPILFKDRQALQSLTHFADYVLTHNREIVVPQDDSVIRFSDKNKQKIILRRARGYAPNLLWESSFGSGHILAMGADLKSSFTMQVNGHIYQSQFLGNLESYDALLSFKSTLHHLSGIFDFQPNVILKDMHPGYFSSKMADEIAKDNDIPVLSFQHHKAHFASVLAENDLLDSAEDVLGIVWDGTGWGDDGQIWGGEFFVFENKVIQRVNHFQYVPVIAGDKMASEPRISALSFMLETNGRDKYLQPKFKEIEWKTYMQIAESKPNKMTSSIGRLFDAVSSLLGLKDINSFEGEAAMALEFEAMKAIGGSGNHETGYRVTIHHPVQVEPIVNGIVEDLNKGLSVEKIALKFHITLVGIIRQQAEESKVNCLAFSGGVFQNALLVDLIIDRLGSEFQLYFHKQLSPNDESVAFGQMALYYIQNMKIER